MSRDLPNRLNAERHRRFVGRIAERDLFRSALAADVPPFNVWSPRRAPAALGRLRPYTFHIALVLYWPILLYADAQAQTLAQQHVLGIFTFALLFLATRFSPQSERRQVWVMMGIATCVELFCTMVWGLYRYRWGNVPLFVPPGAWIALPVRAESRPYTADGELW